MYIASIPIRINICDISCVAGYFGQLCEEDVDKSGPISKGFLPQKWLISQF